MNLVIVESPTKARTLSRFLGEDYVVEATKGHIKDLPKSPISVDIENNFEPQYALVPKREDTVEQIKSKSKNAETIFLATDPDREGEAISAHIAEILDSQASRQPDSVKRIVFHEITKEAVEEAIANPREIDKNLVDAQTARRVLDRLVGYKLSPLLWRKIRRGLSAGRVQTVAVRLIVEREREIEAFKAQEYWEIWVEVKGESEKGKSESFQVKLIKIGDKPAEVNNGKDAEMIVAQLKDAAYKVLEVKKRQIKKNPYAPFTTSTMTQTAARVFGWSAKKTMSNAQKLYEEGLITYHRTDSTNISKGAIDRLRGYIEKEYGEKYLSTFPRIYKISSKVAQEAHEAIRPTDIKSTFQIKETRFIEELERLYNLIWRRFVASQMAESVYDETTIDVSAVQYLLRASGQIMIFDGWRKVIPVKKELETEIVILPDVKKDDPLDFIKVDSLQKFTEPPARYNEASLIKTLEKLGIGRPSTYAPTISTILVRQYVEKDEGKFIPTPVGIAVNDFLIGNFPETFEYQFTAEMENNLDEIANGKVEWQALVKDFWTPFAKKLETVGEKSKRIKIEVEKTGKVCPECKEGELVIRIGRFGKFISCSRFPDCKYTEKYLEKVGIKCPECKEGDVIIKKSGKGRKFFGCSRYPDCKWASWKSPQTKAAVDRAQAS